MESIFDSLLGFIGCGLPCAEANSRNLVSSVKSESLPVKIVLLDGSSRGRPRRKGNSFSVIVDFNRLLLKIGTYLVC